MTRGNNTTLSELLGHALEESMSLLAACVFSASRGAYRQSELAAVSTMVTPAEESGAYHVQVMCHDPGHLGIDYEGIPLILIERGSGDERIGFLDGRGRTEFRLSMRADTELRFEPVRPERVAEVKVPESMLAGHFAPGVEPVRKVDSSSPDGSVSAVARLAGEGELWISVRAHVEALQNGEVYVVLRSRRVPADIWVTDKIPLDLNGGMEGAWMGHVGRGPLRERAEDATLLVLPVAQR